MSDQAGISNQQQVDDTPSIFKPLAMRRQSNQAAVVGLVLAVLLWPVGLVVSIVALRRASKRGGVGLYKAIGGVLASIIFAVATLALLTTGPASVSDPACGPALASLAGLGPTILSDQTQLNADSGKAAEKQDLAQFLGILQPVENGLKVDISLSEHESVRDEISIAYGDTGLLVYQLQQLQKQSGDYVVLQLTSYSDSLTQDISGVNQVCKASPAPTATQ